MSTALKWKLLVGFVLVFLAGGMTGGFFGASQARHLFFAQHHHRGVLAGRVGADGTVFLFQVDRNGRIRNEPREPAIENRERLVRVERGAEIPV